MTAKPPAWADLLLTLWVIAVGLIYYGGYFAPATIGGWTGRAAAVYAVLLLTAVAVSILNVLRRPRPGPAAGENTSVGHPTL